MYSGDEFYDDDITSGPYSPDFDPSNAAALEWFGDYKDEDDDPPYDDYFGTTEEEPV